MSQPRRARLWPVLFVALILGTCSTPARAQEMTPGGPQVPVDRLFPPSTALFITRASAPADDPALGGHVPGLRADRPASGPDRGDGAVSSDSGNTAVEASTGARSDGPVSRLYLALASGREAAGGGRRSDSGESAATPGQGLRSPVPPRDFQPPAGPTRRFPILGSMYVSYVGLQVADVLSTARALERGGREINPLLPFASNRGAMLAMKGATAAATIYLSEKVAKRSRVASIVMMAAINSAYAAIVAHNYRVARALR